MCEHSACFVSIEQLSVFDSKTKKLDLDNFLKCVTSIKPIRFRISEMFHYIYILPLMMFLNLHLPPYLHESIILRHQISCLMIHFWFSPQISPQIFMRILSGIRIGILFAQVNFTPKNGKTQVKMVDSPERCTLNS